MAGASTSAAVSMKEYLKKYQTGTDTDDKNKPKKTKKKKKVENPKSTAMGGVLVVDEDPVWQKPVIIEEEDDSDSAGEAETLVEEDIEVRRMKRLEAIRAKNPYNSISEDGSGWIPVANSPPQNSPDLSPPRQRRKRLDTPSPDRRSRADLSPPRRNADLSPPRRRARHDSVETADLSPPRRRGRHDSVETADLSPPRRRSRHDSVETADRSPPRRRSRHDSVETADLSPRRRKSRFDSDKTADLSPPRRARADVAEKREKAAPRRGGFFTTEEIKEEIKQKKEEERIRLLDASISGKNAETIFRDKATGKRVSKEDLLKNAKKQEKPKESEKELEWGKGLAQKRKLEERALELEKEKITPFARSRDDPELDKMLKETVRWGDPMAHLARKKNMETILEDLGDDERMKESGFIIPQNIPNHSWIKRGVDFPENRYGIKPGRHWDGVDRSNGFEKDMFKRQNEKRATEQEAYLWSVADM